MSTDQPDNNPADPQAVYLARPLETKELAPLKFTATVCFLIAFVGMCLLLAALDEPQSRKSIWFWGLLITSVLHAPLGIGIIRRQEWARVAYFWLPMIFFGFAWPFGIVFSLLVTGTVGVCYMLGGNFLMSPRIRAAFESKKENCWRSPRSSPTMPAISHPENPNRDRRRQLQP